MSFEEMEKATDLTDLVNEARSGLKSDVAKLVAELEQGVLFLPLARAIPGLNHGDKISIDNEITVSPHVLVDADDRLFVALFTREEMIGPVRDAMEWLTDDQELEYCGLPATLALKIAYDACASDAIAGAVVNAMDDTELVLHQDELGHLTQGQAIPFVAYVEDASEEDAEALDPERDLPPELRNALDACVQEFAPIQSYSAARAFDPERDREPHLVLSFVVVSGATADGSLDQAQLRGAISARLEGAVPPPGYVDILFENQAY